MNNAIFTFKVPENEPIFDYKAGSEERKRLDVELQKLSNQQIDIPLIIDGKEIKTGKTGNVVMPHDHNHILATYHMAGEEEVQLAIDAALRAREKWESMSWLDRASIMLRAAELLSTKYRPLINAATMLGQDKTAYQAEIDSACETIDFLRYNVFFASQVYNEQPKSAFGQFNRLEYRGLEGFVFTITPFNFTAIASNLNMSVAMMGNTTVWKPATTSLLSSYYLMKIFEEAGLPPGVINFVPGKGSVIGNVALSSKHLAGIHFTGSNSTFNNLWKTVANNLDNYISYPKIVGETGGKDFIFVHKSASELEVATAITRGSFEYQGQKCSAASRAYIPKSLWPEIKKHLLKQLHELKVGDVTDYSNFMGAVIDHKSYENIMRYINIAKECDDCNIIAGGNGDDSVGYFIEPTVIVTKNPKFITMEEEIFGPLMTIYIYDDADYIETLELCNNTSPFALTGSIFSNDKYAMHDACKILRYAAGNFYVNDKPTGAAVGLQPFGGSRASGTNDKAGGSLNLLRWVSPRTIKETFIPATDFKYPHME